MKCPTNAQRWSSLHPQQPFSALRCTCGRGGAWPGGPCHSHGAGGGGGSHEHTAGQRCHWTFGTDWASPLSRTGVADKQSMGCAWLAAP